MAGAFRMRSRQNQKRKGPKTWCVAHTAACICPKARASLAAVRFTVAMNTESCIRNNLHALRLAQGMSRPEVRIHSLNEISQGRPHSAFCQN